MKNLAAVLFSALPVGAENTIDIPSSWANDYVANIKNTSAISIDKLMNNYQRNITRGEFAYLCVKLYEYYTGQEIIEGEKYFKDTLDEWVLKAKRASLVNGDPDNIYRTDDYIHREEIAVLFVNVFVAADAIYKDETSELFADDSTISKWAKKSVYIAKANKIIGGIGKNKFDPSGFATREQALVMLSRAIPLVPRNLSRLPKFGIDKIVLRDVESSIQSITLTSGPRDIAVLYQRS